MPTLARYQPRRRPRRTALTAAARPTKTRATTTSLDRPADWKHKPSADIRAWQSKAFDAIEAIGELHYALAKKAEVVSRGGFRVMEPDPDGTSADDLRAVEDDDVLAVLDAFRPPPGTPGGAAGQIRRAALHLEVAGETFLVGEPLTPAARKQSSLKVGWEFLSPEEYVVDGDGGRPRRRYGGWFPDEAIDLGGYVARLWRQDGRFGDRPDCALRSVLPICRQIQLLTDLVDAVAETKLSAPLLLLPEELDLRERGGVADIEGFDDTDDDPDGLNAFLADLVRHLTEPIRDNRSAARWAPIIMRGPAEFLDKIKTIDLARDLDSFAAELRAEALRRLARGLDIPPETMEGVGQTNHWCVDTATEILTRDRGWVTEDQLFPGDEVLTLDHTTGLTEWQPVLHVARWVVEDLEMVAMEGKRHSSLTTLGHRWPVLHTNRENLRDADGCPTTRVTGRTREWRTTDTLRSNDAIITAAPHDAPVEAKWTDAFVELVAWFWTEGTVRHRDGRRTPQVELYQSHDANPTYTARIRRALTALYGPACDGPMPSGRRNGPDATPRWREVRHSNGKTTFRLNAAAAAPLLDIAPDRVVALDWIQQLTVAQLDLFIDTSIAADGWHHGTSSTRYLSQSDRDRLPGLELAAILAGYSTSIYQIASGAWMLSIGDHPTMAPHRNAERVTYTGTIWCPVTPNTTWLARRDGKVFYTGNSAYAVSGDFLTNHVIPLGDLIAEFLTESYLRPMLMAAKSEGGLGMAPAKAAEYTVAFDPSALSEQADEGPTFRELHAARLISDEAARRANGAGTEDAPDDDETARRFLETIIPHGPKAIIPKLAEMYGIEWTDEDTEALGGSAPAEPPPPEQPAADGDSVPEQEEAADPNDANDEPDMPDVDDVADQAAKKTPPKKKTAKTPPPDTVAASAAVDDTGLLVERLTTAAHFAVERAVERAAGRITNLARRQPAIKARLEHVPTLEVPAAVTSAELAAIGATIDDLLGDAWTRLALQARPWVREWFETRGVDRVTADERAAWTVQVLCDHADTVARQAFTRPLGHQPNGLRLGPEAALTALGLHAMV